LTAEGILSRPNYIPRPTGRELYVSDDLYKRLVREPKDLPEDIIEKLASDAQQQPDCSRSKKAISSTKVRTPLPLRIYLT
jgi:hypothetical protein